MRAHSQGPHSSHCCIRSDVLRLSIYATCLHALLPATRAVLCGPTLVTLRCAVAQAEKERTETQSFVAKALNASLSTSPVESEEDQAEVGPR